jgi:hypothetical protein
MTEKSASEQIDDIINQYDGWKAELLEQLRKIITSADSRIEEEVKWKMPSSPKGLPVFSYQGIVCIIQTFKNDTKLVFFKGAFLDDTNNLFNARLESATDRAIEFHEGYSIDKAGIKDLVVQAVNYNTKSKN